MLQVNRERRHSPRASVMLSANMESSAFSVAIKLRNVSSGGALVEGGALPGPGAQVMFDRNGRVLSSLVVWVRGHRSGIRFDQPVDPKAALRPVPPPRNSPRLPQTRRPGLKCKPLSEGQERLLNEWASLGLTALGD